MQCASVQPVSPNWNSGIVSTILKSNHDSFLVLGRHFDKAEQRNCYCHCKQYICQPQITEDG